MHIYIHIPDIDGLACSILDGNISALQMAINLLTSIQNLKKKGELPKTTIWYSEKQKKEIGESIEGLKKSGKEKKVLSYFTRFWTIFDKVVSSAWEQKTVCTGNYNYAVLDPLKLALQEPMSLPNELAEATERSIQESEEVYLMPLEPITHTHIYVIRCAGAETLPRLSSIEVLLDSDTIIALSKQLLAPDEYDIATATNPPTDSQTILRDPTKFEPTTFRPCQGRKIFRAKDTGYLFYVDNLHVGRAAHMEVFNSKGKEYIGEADILTGKITKKTDTNKQPLIK